MPNTVPAGAPPAVPGPVRRRPDGRGLLVVAIFPLVLAYPPVLLALGVPQTVVFSSAPVIVYLALEAVRQVVALLPNARPPAPTAGVSPSVPSGSEGA